jgi:hypothetical protein
MAANKRFWDFPRHSKLGILNERLHVKVMLDALQDAETCIEPIEKGYCLYGETEALIAYPQTAVLRLCFMIYCAVVSFLRLDRIPVESVANDL